MNPTDDGSRRDGPVIDIWMSLVIIGRVVMILVLFLALFVAIFVGYFTVPIVLVGIVTVIYMLSDLGLYMTLKRRQQTRREREEFLRSYSEKSGHKD